MGENNQNKRFDVQAVSFDGLDWSEDKKTESLSTLFSLLEQRAKNVISWYLLSKKFKKQCEQILRITVILLTTLAAIIPIVAELFPGFSPIWATFVLALAAMCVAIDRYFGCSNAWIRYIITEHKVRQDCLFFKLSGSNAKLKGKKEYLTKRNYLLLWS